MSHLYIVVSCKTKGCHAVHVLMHLGEKGKAPEKVAYWMSCPLLLYCPNCKKNYDYSDSEEQFRQAKLPAPPVGYLDRLATPPIHGSASLMQISSTPP